MRGKIQQIRNVPLNLLTILFPLGYGSKVARNTIDASKSVFFSW